MYGFLRRPAWIGLHIVVLVITVSFALLGQWQLRRLSERRVENADVAEQLILPPRQWSSGTGDFPNEYRQLMISGSYRPDEEVLLRSQVHLGQPGYDILTPFYTTESAAVLVNRGWIPLDLDTPPIGVASPPSGELTVTGIVRYPLEGSGVLTPSSAQGPVDSFSRVDLGRIDQQVEGDLQMFYIELGGSDDTAETLPIVTDLPELGEGPHFSYAMQWFAFALVSITGYAALIRSTAKRR